jgi:hypothetical protein
VKIRLKGVGHQMNIFESLLNYTVNVLPVHAQTVIQFSVCLAKRKFLLASFENSYKFGRLFRSLIKISVPPALVQMANKRLVH